MKNKILKTMMVGVGIFSLVSCGGSKALTREEAMNQLNAIEQTDTETPTKFTFQSSYDKSLSSSLFANYDFGGIDTFADTAESNIKIVLSTSDQYFHFELTGFSETTVYYKDSSLYLYTMVLGNGVSVKLNVDFQTELEVLKKLGIDFKSILDEYSTDFCDEIFDAIDQYTDIEESYSTTGAGNLSANLKYTHSSKYEVAFEINSYFVTKFNGKINDKPVIDFSLDLNTAKIEIPNA